MFSGRPHSCSSGLIIPSLEANSAPISFDPKRLARFCNVVDHDDPKLIPPTFPQVLAAPLHLALFTDKRFPINPTGIVHLENKITMMRAIAVNEVVCLSCRILDRGETGRGHELLLETELTDRAGEIVWQAGASLLSRFNTGKRTRRQRPRAVRVSLEDVQSWTASAATGRQYARVSGDFNPIHLTTVTARLLGFDRAIAHGMWSIARSLSALRPLPTPPLTIDVSFRRPLLLPADLSLVASQSDARHFELRNTQTRKAYLKGQITPVTDET